MIPASILHGGPDHGPPIVWDVSTNANAVPPPPHLLAQLAQADRSRYPDPGYTALRLRLAAAQLGRADQASADRIIPTAGSSEGIRRLSLAAKLCGVRQVWVPQPAYADYALAAQALGLHVMPVDEPMAWLDLQAMTPADAPPSLLWLCEPCNPTGGSLPAAFWARLAQVLCSRTSEQWPSLMVALDRAYEPLRLDGHDPVPASLAAQCWQLWSPNKALGLTGVRAGWITAPDAVAGDLAERVRRHVQALAPSWVLSAEGVTLLMHWHDEATQAWLRASLAELQGWRRELRQGLADRAWLLAPSVTLFVLAQAPRPLQPHLPSMHAQLRQQGIKWRDGHSFGLPGHIRLRAHCPQAQAAFFAALDAATAACHGTAPMMPAMPPHQPARPA